MNATEMVTGAVDKTVNSLWDNICERYAAMPELGADPEPEVEVCEKARLNPVTDLSLRHFNRFPAFDYNRFVTDVFDLIAGLYWAKLCSSRGPGLDLKTINIDHLVSEEEREDPSLIYSISDQVPDIEFKRKYRLPFLDINDGTFPSPVTTPFEENNTVYVKHYKLRRKPGGGPTVVMVNGLYVNDYSYFDWWCWRFAAWGLSSVLIDLPYHIRRVPKGSYCGEYLLTPDTDWSGLGLKQSFQDIQQLINWLKAEGSESVGLFGISFGAWMAGVYVCHALNAEFAIMAMPPMDAVKHLSKLNFGDELRQMEARGETSMLTDPKVPPIFDMVNMRPKVPNNKIFIAKGLYDQLVTPESIDATVEAWGGLPWLRQYPTGHINTYVLNHRFNADVKKFILGEVLNRG